MNHPTFAQSIFVHAERQGPAAAAEHRHDPFYELTLELEHLHPVEMLDFAARTLAAVGDGQRQLRRDLFVSGYYETSLLMKSLEWLAERRSPESLLDPDTPAWLFDLDQGRLRAAKRRKDPDGQVTYFVEIELADGTSGCVQVRVDAQGAICNAFAMTDQIDFAVALLQGIEHDRRAYRTIKPATARRALRAARSKFDDLAAHEPERFNPWPANRALLDFVLDHFSATD